MSEPVYYDLVVRHSPSALIAEVRTIIETSDLVPLGAPFVSNGEWAQAMVHRNLSELEPGDPNK